MAAYQSDSAWFVILTNYEASSVSLRVSGTAVITNKGYVLVIHI